MKKSNYNAKLRRAEMHLAAKQHGKALKEFVELYNTDKPLGKKLGLPSQIKKCEDGLKDDKFSVIRGLGVIVLEALNKKNKFQEIYRLPIERRTDNAGNDIHPLRLPVVLQTRFIKATNEDELNKEIEKFKNSKEDNPNSELKIEELEEVHSTLKSELEKLGKERDKLLENTKTLENDLKASNKQNEVLSKEIKDLSEDKVDLQGQLDERDPEKISELKVEHETALKEKNEEIAKLQKKLKKKEDEGKLQKKLKKKEDEGKLQKKLKKKEDEGKLQKKLKKKEDEGKL